MKHKSEAEHTAELVKALRAVGAVVYIAWAGKHVIKGRAIAAGQDGFPDRHITHKVWTGWLELKLVGGRLSDAQRSIIKAMNEQEPGSALVGWFEDEGINITDETNTWAIKCPMKITTVLYGLANARAAMQAAAVARMKA